MFRSSSDIRAWIAFVTEIQADDVNGGGGVVGGDQETGTGDQTAGAGDQTAGAGRGNSNANDSDAAPADQLGTTAALQSALAPTQAQMPDNTTVGNFGLYGPVVAAPSYSVGTGAANTALAGR